MRSLDARSIQPGEFTSAMTRNSTDQTHERLDLGSQLGDIAQVPAWIEQLASRYSIPKDLQFAMELCLEEALANTIIYGYRREAGNHLSIDFTSPSEGRFVFVVEDEAPKFNPLEGPELPPVNEADVSRVGGQGIRLLRRFAHTLDYDATPRGNRLRIGFSAANV